MLQDYINYINFAVKIYEYTQIEFKLNNLKKKILK